MFVAAGLITLAVARNAITILAAGVLYGVGYGTSQPSLNALAVNRVAAVRRGAATAASSLETVFLVSTIPTLVGVLLLVADGARQHRAAPAPSI
ncbi:MAG: hypothetical protein Kow00122_13840 [Thermoleophilia bacterium]